MSKTLADFVDAALQRVEEIEPEAAARLLGDDAWNFVDVREPDEFAAGHLPGARNFPRGFLEVKADLAHKKRDPWLEDRERPMLLYCGGGHRSALAADTLQQMGFKRVVSLRGGWTQWLQHELPVEG